MAFSSAAVRVADVFIRALQEEIDECFCKGARGEADIALGSGGTDLLDTTPHSCEGARGSLPDSSDGTRGQADGISDDNDENLHSDHRAIPISRDGDRHEQYVLDEYGVPIDIDAFRRFSRFENPFSHAPSDQIDSTLDYNINDGTAIPVSNDGDRHEQYVLDESGVPVDLHAFERFSRFEEPFGRATSHEVDSTLGHDVLNGTGLLGTATIEVATQTVDDWDDVSDLSGPFRALIHAIIHRNWAHLRHLSGPHRDLLRALMRRHRCAFNRHNGRRRFRRARRLARERESEAEFETLLADFTDSDDTAVAPGGEGGRRGDQPVVGSMDGGGVTRTSLPVATLRAGADPGLVNLPASTAMFKDSLAFTSFDVPRAPRPPGCWFTAMGSRRLALPFSCPARPA